LLKCLAGRVQRPSCLFIYNAIVEQHFIGSTLGMPWREFCELLPVREVRALIDHWLLSSGAAANLLVLATYATELYMSPPG
jgi:hypothetical protein